MENKEVYFAAEEDPKEVAAYLDKKAKYWFDSLVENNYLQKIRRSWDAYHGYYYDRHFEYWDRDCFMHRMASIGTTYSRC